MSDLISRTEALEEMAQAECGLHYVDCETDNCSCAYITRILDLPSVSADRPRGRWHYSNGKPATIGQSFGVICDQCGTESEYCTNFCGECGADMRETKGANEWTKK